MRLSESRILNHPVDAVWKLVGDPANHARFFAGMRDMAPVAAPSGADAAQNAENVGDGADAGNARAAGDAQNAGDADNVGNARGAEDARNAWDARDVRHVGDGGPAVGARYRYHLDIGGTVFGADAEIVAYRPPYDLSLVNVTGL